MKAQIKYLSASAGSGKTHALVEAIKEALLTKQCSPCELIATTFTRQAAEELKRKLVGRLLEADRSDLVAQLDSALVGTVHGVCRELLQRYAIEAGLSPSIRVLDRDESRTLLDQVTDRAVAPVDIARIQAIGDRLNQRAYQQPRLWQRQLRSIVELARSNRIPPGKLAEMADKTSAAYLAQYPSEQADLESYLRQVIAVALTTLPAKGDATRVTENYVQQLHDFVERLDHGELEWADWLKLANAQPAVRSCPFARCVQLVAEQFVAHPGFQQDIQEYIAGLYCLAAKVLEEFHSVKRRHGTLDFGDLEEWTLRLLKENEAVRKECAGQFRLLMVDEFQDTSPIQLALFVELAGLTGHATWVGDPKQSIYGFRGCDAKLITATVEELRQNGFGIHNLEHSWRSTPELVTLVNQLFAEPFQKGETGEKTELRSQRGSLQNPQPALELVTASSGQTRWDKSPVVPQKAEYADALAARVRTLLGNKEYQVLDRELNEERLVRPDDVVILCQSNGYVQTIAGSLRKQGIAVRQSQPGLLATPEVRLAMACLRVGVDSEDTLARAEVLFLAESWSREDILADRIGFIEDNALEKKDSWAEEAEANPTTLKELVAIRERVATLSLADLVDEVVQTGKVLRIITEWGPTTERAAQRRANVEAFRSLAGKYASRCSNTHRPVTAFGFIQWCRDLAEEETDLIASGNDANAIHVLTYHAAKGLEWPVVICTQLDNRVRDRWSEPAAVVATGTQFRLDDPLRGREIRFWPSPFGDRDASSQPYVNLMKQPAMLSANEQSREEALRLLYVGFSRARDLLILVEREGAPMRWLEQAGVSLPPGADGNAILSDGTSVPSRQVTALPDEASRSKNDAGPSLWFGPSVKSTPKPAARIAPSEQPPVENCQVAEIIEYAPPLTVPGAVDPVALGSAVHCLLATDTLDPTASNRSALVRRILTNHQIEHALDVDQTVENLERFRNFIRSHFRPSHISVETPFSFHNASGQVVSGFIDLCLETPHGMVIIDHKVLSRQRSELPATSLQYSGQLNCYRAAVITTDRAVGGTWIHSPISGVMLRIDASTRAQKLTPSRAF